MLLAHFRFKVAPAVMAGGKGGDRIDTGIPERFLVVCLIERLTDTRDSRRSMEIEMNLTKTKVMHEQKILYPPGMIPVKLKSYRHGQQQDVGPGSAIGARHRRNSGGHVGARFGPTGTQQLAQQVACARPVTAQNVKALV